MDQQEGWTKKGVYADTLPKFIAKNATTNVLIRTACKRHF